MSENNEGKRWIAYKKAIIDTPPAGYSKDVKYIWDFKWNTPTGRDKNATIWTDTISGKQLTLPEGFYWDNDGLVTDGEHQLSLGNMPYEICVVTTEGTGGLYRHPWVSPSYDVKLTVGEGSLTFKVSNSKIKTVSVPRNNVHTYWVNHSPWTPTVYYGDKTGANQKISITGTSSSSAQSSKTMYLCTDGSTFYKGKIQQIRVYSSFHTSSITADSKIDRERFNLY